MAKVRESRDMVNTPLPNAELWVKSTSEGSASEQQRRSEQQRVQLASDTDPLEWGRLGLPDTHHAFP